MNLKGLKNVLGGLSGIFGRSKQADIETVEKLLIQADVGVQFTHSIIQKIKKEPENLKKEIYNLINLPLPQISSTKPVIIMVSGVNGSGKTTTVAKLANLFQKTGTVLLASADTYRDAASEQLEIWARKVNVEIVRSQKGQDAGAVVYDAISKAFVKKIDTVLIDTAGRLHTRSDLMEELKKIKRVITKLKPGGPDLNLLTIDATLGQNSIQQARIFTKELGINGLILTKFDGTAKGGAIIPICNELKLPVLYLGVGEGIEDLIEFNPKEFVEVLFSEE